MFSFSKQILADNPYIMGLLITSLYDNQISGTQTENKKKQTGLSKGSIYTG